MTASPSSKSRPRPTVRHAFGNMLMRVGQDALVVDPGTKGGRDELAALCALLDSLTAAYSVVAPDPGLPVDVSGALEDLDPQDYEDADQGLDFDAEHSDPEEGRPIARRIGFTP